VPFEASLAELNDLVNRLESGSLGLSDSIGAYELGVAILRRLHEQPRRAD
jgi:exodeoxyribonuclease VII small subunit